jgi:5-methylthioribose kinase
MTPVEGLASPTGADKASELAHTIQSHWDPLERLCLERTTERALSYAEPQRQAFNPALSVLEHGDAHQGKALVAPDSATGFKLIDPDGAFAERAFDLAVMMHECGKVMPQADIVRLASQPLRSVGKIQRRWPSVNLGVPG